MKKYLILLLCLLTLPSLAGPPDPRIDGGPLQVGPPPAELSGLLAVIQGVEGPGEYTATATYFESERAVHVEVLRFQVEGVQDDVVELLAFSPEQRKSFLASFEERSILLEHPDGSSEMLRFEDVLADTRTWQQTGQPLATLLEVTSPRHADRSQPGQDLSQPGEDYGLVQAASSCDQTCCQSQCWQEYDWCEQSCGPSPAEDCLERCDAYMQDCWEECEACPVITEWTTTTLESHTYIGGQLCLEDHLYPYPWEGPKWYDRYQRNLKHTTYRRTKACDGSVTTQVINTSYSYDHCWRWTPQQCTNPQPNSWTYCRYY